MAPQVEIRTLLLLELLDVERLFETLEVEKAGEIVARHDLLARELLERFGGREIEKARRFLFLFERPLDAVRYALAHLEGLVELGDEFQADLAARSAIHLGDVLLWPNPPEAVDRGAKKLEVEGPARLAVERLIGLARGRQILLTRSAYELARRSWVGEAEMPGLRWVEHGPYRFPPIAEEIEVFEVGLEGRSPLEIPRVVQDVQGGAAVEEEAESWRPEPGRAIPQRPHFFLEYGWSPSSSVGEAWLAIHGKTRERRIFKFATERGDRQRLEAQVESYKRVREAAGLRRDLVRLLDWDLEGDPAFVELEGLPERSWEGWSRTRDGFFELAPAERLAWWRRVVEAVAAIHGAGEAHGDLQPGHVVLRLDAREQPEGICLVELPLGRVKPQLVHKTSGERERYRPPEARWDVPPTARGDVYALGVMLYQALAGDFTKTPGPFWQRDVGDEQIATELAKMIEPDPEARLADAREIPESLDRLGEEQIESEAAREEENIELEASKATIQKLRGWVVASSCLAALLLAALLWVLA